MSLSLLASSSFLKSFVFCARSFLCVRVSRWCATRSEATVSSCGMSEVRSMSGASSAYMCRLVPQRAVHTSPCADSLLELVAFFGNLFGCLRLLAGGWWSHDGILHVNATLHGSAAVVGTSCG